MRCFTCRHINPPDSKFCNQCGHSLFVDELSEATQDFATVEVKRFGIPGSALGKVLPVAQVLHPSIASAYAAMNAIGAMVQPSLQQDMRVAGLGNVIRCYAVLGNNLHSEEVTDAGTQTMDLLAFSPAEQEQFGQVSRSIDNRCERALRGWDNERVLEKLRDGRLKYMPVNRLLAKRIAQDIAPLGLHLPWSIGGIDVAFGRVCREALKGFGFVNYFGYLGRLEEADGQAIFRQTRETSVPFGVDGYHTWEAAIGDDIVDEDCALLIEADARPIK